MLGEEEERGKEEEEEEGRRRKGEGKTLSLILTCPESTSTSTSSLHTLPRMPHLESLQVINLPLIDKFNEDKDLQKHPKIFNSQELIKILHSRLAPLVYLPDLEESGVSCSKPRSILFERG